MINKKYNYNVFLITNQQISFLNAEDFISYYPNDIRHYVAAVSQCDYFVGIDSSGQHIARSFNIPGSIIMGGSNTVNTTYPDFFNICNDKIGREYQFFGPFTDLFDNYLKNIENSYIMDLCEKDIKELCNNIQKHMKRSIK